MNQTKALAQELDYLYKVSSQLTLAPADFDRLATYDLVLGKHCIVEFCNILQQQIKDSTMPKLKQGLLLFVCMHVMEMYNKAESKQLSQCQGREFDKYGHGLN